MTSTFQNRPQPISSGEKIISAASYITTGIVGLLWIVLSAATSSKLKPFLRFHIYQSILISILYYLSTLILNLFVGIAIKIPIVGSLVYTVYFYLFSRKVFLGYSIVDSLILIILGYLLLCCIRGVTGNIPFITKITKSMM